MAFLRLPEIVLPITEEGWVIRQTEQGRLPTASEDNHTPFSKILLKKTMELKFQSLQVHVQNVYSRIRIFSTGKQ